VALGLLVLLVLVLVLAERRGPAASPPRTPLPASIARLQIADHAQSIPPYDREAWPLWVDEDHDCQDTRQEVLVVTSTDVGDIRGAG
jgi:hypothetical protein